MELRARVGGGRAAKGAGLLGWRLRARVGGGRAAKGAGFLGWN